MSIEEIRNKISVINAETARLNTQRNQNIGRQETLKKQLSDACELYKKNYGVDLTAENLQSELLSVTKKKEEEISKIEQILSLINAGNITEANKLAGVEVFDATHVAQEITQSASDDIATPPVAPSVPPTVETPVAPPVSEVVTPPVQDVVTPPIPEVVAPQVAPPVAPPTPPKAQTQVLTGADSLDVGMPALEGFSKPSLGSITPPPKVESQDAPTPPKSPVQDFSAILNGTAFMPN